MIQEYVKVTECGPKSVLEIGRQGEYNVRQVIFDMSEVIGDVGSGTATIIHYPYDGSPYEVPTRAGESYDAAVQDGSTLTWTIGQLATQHKGEGICAVSWTTSTGLLKSRRYKTSCKPWIGTPTGDVEAQQSYIDQMTVLAANMASSVSATETAASSAASSATAAATSASNAATSESNAATSASAASTSASNAATSESNAQHYADLAQQGAEAAGYAWFDVNEEDGNMYVTITDSMAQDVTFAVNESAGTLEVTVNG